MKTEYCAQRKKAGCFQILRAVKNINYNGYEEIAVATSMENAQLIAEALNASADAERTAELMLEPARRQQAKETRRFALFSWDSH